MFSKEREYLKNIILIQAKHFLETYDEFYPYGAVILDTNELRPFSAFGQDEHPKPEQVIEFIIAAFIKGAKTNRYIAVAMAIDVLYINPQTNKKVDAIEIKIDSKLEGSINYYVTYSRDKNKINFGEIYIEPGTLKIW
jgi:hypothetical protein